MARISVLGAGRMGAALVGAFAKSGHSVTVWKRTARRAKLEAVHRVFQRAFEAGHRDDDIAAAYEGMGRG